MDHLHSQWYAPMKCALDLSGKSPATPWGRNLSYHPHVHYIVPAGVLKKDWNVDSRPVGTGVCTLSYFSAYVFRTAISDKR